MIVVLDTNSFYGDVYARKQDLTALFAAVDDGLLENVEIWTPRAVVGELARQFRERSERMTKVLGEISFDLSSFSIQRPTIPDTAESRAAEYRDGLERRLCGRHRSIAAHPDASGKILDWAAEHRAPIKTPGPPQPKKGERDLSMFAKRETKPIYGVVDAGIWLTVVEAAQQSDVVLITGNRTDFADTDDPSKPHKLLADELDAAGLNPRRVQICQTVQAFNEQHVRPAEDARAKANAFLADEGKLEALKSEIADAVSWFPLELGEKWDLEVETDSSTLAEFDPTALELVRADLGPDAYFMTIWATGQARFDLTIRKYDASGIDARSPISVYDWDWNESMVAAELEMSARMLVEIRVSDGEDLAVSIEEIDSIPIG
ncbi:MAG TPA: hypothetical protein VK680_07840 [Solirubrobacteraceae bacterium]|jgi:hypothetical protein|nr:hypothetical protein [Solirubrobacteraceae bacterium]